jgi:hypothetical protein
MERDDALPRAQRVRHAVFAEQHAFDVARIRDHDENHTALDATSAGLVQAVTSACVNSSGTRLRVKAARPTPCLRTFAAIGRP